MAKFSVLMPVDNAGDWQSDSRTESLKAQTLSDWKAYILPGNANIASDDSRFVAGPDNLDTFAKLINWASDQDGEYIVTLPAGVRLNADALEQFAAKLDGDVSIAGTYSSYVEKKADGTSQEITIFPHEGAPHERFDFGFVRVYRVAALKEIGGVRTDLAHAAEYDLDLRLTDNKKLDVVANALYEVDTAPKEGTSLLHSPGKGKLGGFSYIFYPADMEKEITGVFEEMLRRRNAWIDHATVPVQYPAEPYEVKATVVIPVLNRAKFIGNAIDRVLEGTFQDFEVVIIDNGSTDGTQAVVEEYVAKNPGKVRLLHGKGGSISSALNEGIKAAKGKYICQLDSDDEYTPDTLELMVGHFEAHPNCGLAISYYELMDENRGKVEGIDPVTHSGYTRNQILRRDGGGALRVFPKAVLEEMGYYDEVNYGNFGEDYDMVLKVGEKYDVDRVHKVLYRYRRHSDNTDVTRDPLMKIQNKNNSRQDALRRRTAYNKSK